MKKDSKIKKTLGTSRIEAFSDSIFVFCITLLIMNIKIPALTLNTSDAAMSLMVQQLPQLSSFVLSFLIIAILWVNHHHFFQNFKFTDWKLLWYNNFLLFWVILIPFVTNFIGAYPFIPLVVAIYAGVMFMVSVSFLLMVRYVFFKSHLLDIKIPEQERKSEFNHTLPAVILYGFTIILAFYITKASLIMLVLVPMIYFVPSFLHREERMIEHLPSN